MNVRKFTPLAAALGITSLFLLFYFIEGTTPIRNLKLSFKPLPVSNILPPAPLPANDSGATGNVFISTSALPAPAFLAVPATGKPVRDPFAQVASSGAPPLSIFSDLVEPLKSINVSDNRLIPLPDVSRGELSFRETGLESIEEYLIYLNKNSRSIKFAYQKLSGLKDSGGIPQFAQEFINKALAQNDFSAHIASLRIIEEFLQKKMEYLETIPVRGEALEINKKMIGFDKLTLDLIQKFYQTANGKMDRPSFENFYKDYKYTASFYNGKFSQALADRSWQNSSDPFKRLLSKAGLTPLARASSGLTPFGATASQIKDVCVCIGMIITMDLIPSHQQNNMMITWVAFASPLLYIYKTPFPEAYILGHYAEAAMPCLQVPYCEEEGTSDSLFVMGGTSLPQ